MTAQPMDAVSSFVHLTDNLPSWLDQLNALAKHTAEKHAEFVEEYKRIVDQIKPKRIKSHSLQSIHSDDDASVHLPDIDPQTGLSIPSKPDPVDVDPLVAGNRYLYAQVQRKRKPTNSIRSGASGPQKFRGKNSVVIYYDAHVQEQFESMVKAIGTARNNLRKGRNALIASRGFQLPTLGRKQNGLVGTPPLDSLKYTTMSKSSPTLTGSRYILRSRPQEPESPEEAAFADADKSLDSLQCLYEKSAHQFLRDGDCKAELNTAAETLQSLLELAKTTVETLTAKSAEQAATIAANEEGDSDVPPSMSESAQTEQSRSLYSQPSYEPIGAIADKSGTDAFSQTLADIQARDLKSAPAAVPTSSMPTAGMTIEVDDGSDDVSIGELMDFTQFRATNPARLRIQR